MKNTKFTVLMLCSILFLQLCYCVCNASPSNNVCFDSYIASSTEQYKLLDSKERNTKMKHAFKKNNIFPPPITNLPEADIPLDGVKAYLSQAEAYQILFMEFDKDVDLPEHSHEAQIGFILEGKVELTIDGKKHIFTKGDRYYIPAGVKHSGKIYAGYADITFFNQPDRYSKKLIRK